MDVLFSQNYGPTWKKREKHPNTSYFKEFPIPDSINCGPVINFNPFAPFPRDPPSANKEIFPVKICQDLAQKFPFKCATPCLQPLQPKFVAHSHSASTSWNTTNYYPSALSSFTLGDHDHLIFGEPSDDSHIVKLATVTRHDSNEETSFKLRKERNLSKYDLFHQADSAVVNGIPYALLRIDDTINFLRIDEDSFTLHSLPGNEAVHCCLNRTLNDSFAFSNENGIVNIYDVVKNKCHWRGQFLDSTNKKWFGCEFWCHPLQMTVACGAGVWLVDSRGDPFAGNNQQIFNLQKMARYIDEHSEVVCNFKNVSGLPFVYVICSDSVFLMDTRHYKHPVLTWHHMMEGQPSYPHSFQANDLSTLLLAQPMRCQICLIPSHWKQCDHPSIQAISSPKHFNIAQDTLAYGRKNGTLFTDHIKRTFESPLVGLTVFPSGERKETHIYLQNKLGNLFYSKFLHRKEKEPLNTDSSLKNLKDFEIELGRQAKPESNYKYESVRYLESLQRKKSFYPHYNFDSFSKTSVFEGDIWHLSRIYCHTNQNQRGLKSIGDNNVIERIIEDKSPLNFFPEKKHNNLRLSFLRKCSDPLSKTLLSVWDEDELNSSKDKKKNPPFFYRRFPLNIEENLKLKVPNFKPSNQTSSTVPPKDYISLDSDTEFYNEVHQEVASCERGTTQLEYPLATPSSVEREKLKKRRSHTIGF